MYSNSRGINPLISDDSNPPSFIWPCIVNVCLLNQPNQSIKHPKALRYLSRCSLTITEYCWIETIDLKIFNFDFASRKLNVLPGQEVYSTCKSFGEIWQINFISFTVCYWLGDFLKYLFLSYVFVRNIIKREDLILLIPIKTRGIVGIGDGNAVGINDSHTRRAFFGLQGPKSDWNGHVLFCIIITILDFHFLTPNELFELLKNS